jgi:hypothetical protein
MTGMDSGGRLAEQDAAGTSAADASTSLYPLPPVLFHGLTAVTVLGFVSFVASCTLFLLLAIRMIRWRRKAPADQPMNQFVVLIFNLLFADIQQSTAFLLNIKWLLDNKLTVGTATCWAQGYFVSNGDVASGLWCTAIGIHTFASVLFNYRLKPAVFYTVIVLIWVFVYSCSTIAIALHPHDLYVRAGAWVRIGSPPTEWRWTMANQMTQTVLD